MTVKFCSGNRHSSNTERGTHFRIFRDEIGTYGGIGHSNQKDRNTWAATDAPEWTCRLYTPSGKKERHGDENQIWNRTNRNSEPEIGTQKLTLRSMSPLAIQQSYGKSSINRPFWNSYVRWPEGRSCFAIAIHNTFLEQTTNGSPKRLMQEEAAQRLPWRHVEHALPGLFGMAYGWNSGPATWDISPLGIPMRFPGQKRWPWKHWTAMTQKPGTHPLFTVGMPCLREEVFRLLARLQVAHAEGRHHLRPVPWLVGMLAVLTTVSVTFHEDAPGEFIFFWDEDSQKDRR